MESWLSPSLLEVPAAAGKSGTVGKQLYSDGNRGGEEADSVMLMSLGETDA